MSETHDALSGLSELLAERTSGLVSGAKDGVWFKDRQADQRVMMWEMEVPELVVFRFQGGHGRLYEIPNVATREWFDSRFEVSA